MCVVGACVVVGCRGVEIGVSVGIWASAQRRFSREEQRRAHLQCGELRHTLLQSGWAVVMVVSLDGEVHAALGAALLSSLLHG
jgi:hypothetical protein